MAKFDEALKLFQENQSLDEVLNRLKNQPKLPGPVSEPLKDADKFPFQPHIAAQQMEKRMGGRLAFAEKPDTEPENPEFPSPEEVNQFYNQDELITREPAASQDQLTEQKDDELPKIEAAPKTQQTALKQIDKQEAEAIKPEKKDLVEEALQRVRENKRMAAIHRATSNLGAAIASTGALTKISPDEQMLKNIEEESEMPVQELKFKQEQEKVQRELANAAKMSDPNSDISKMTRKMFEQLNIGSFGENTSAQDFKNAGVDVENLVAKKIQMDHIKAMRDIELGRKQETANERALDRQRVEITGLVNNLYKSDDAKTFNMASDALPLLDAAIKTGDKAAGGAAFYGFGKVAQQDQSVLRSEDMRTLAGGYNFKDPEEMIQKLSAKASGGDFSTKEFQQMKKIVELSKRIKQQRLQELASPIFKRIEASNLDEGLFFDPSMSERLKRKQNQDIVNKEPQKTIMIREKSTGKKAPVEAVKAEKMLRQDPDLFERID